MRRAILLFLFAFALPLHACSLSGTVGDSSASSSAAASSLSSGAPRDVSLGEVPGASSSRMSAFASVPTLPGNDSTPPSGTGTPPIEIQMATEPQEVQPNGQLRVAFGIRGTSNQDLQNVTAELILPPGLNIVQAPGAEQQGNIARWTVPSLGRGEVATFGLQATVAQVPTDVRNITLTARAGTASMQPVIVQRDVMVIRSLPQTGVDLSVALTYASSATHATGTMLPFLLTGLTGLVAGSTLGRRLLR